MSNPKGLAPTKDNMRIRIAELDQQVLELGEDNIRLRQSLRAAEDALKAGWATFDSAPKDGREVLVAFPKQGNVVILVFWNNMRKYWTSKGEPKLGIENQGCLWTDIPALAGLERARRER